MQQPIIQLKNLTKQFGDHTALSQINFEVNNGEFLTLLGPSGCGKTTLLRLISGFETPDSGNILLNGENITHLPPEKRHINMVFQNYALFPHMNVYDNIAFGLECQRLPENIIRKRVTEIMNKVKLQELAHRKPNQLSGGQQQRVAIARAVVNEPLVLLLDEPLSALDYHLRKNMRIELKGLQRRLGITFILVTHDQEEALSMSDRVVVMNHGTIEQVGTPRDLYEEPNNLYVAKFIGETNIFNTPILSVTENHEPRSKLPNFPLTQPLPLGGEENKVPATSRGVLVNNRIEVKIAGEQVSFITDRRFNVGEYVNIIMRPEDIEVWGINEVDDKEDRLHATVSEVIYKGSTVDLVVTLENGQELFATEFFDEDDENLEYEIGEPVLIRWKPGWEVILPDEK